MANLCRWLSKQLSRDHDRQGAPKGKPSQVSFPSGERPAGATPPTLSCNCRLADRFRCFSFDIHRYGQAKSPMRGGSSAATSAGGGVGVVAAVVRLAGIGGVAVVRPVVIGVVAVVSRAAIVRLSAIVVAAVQRRSAIGVTAIERLAAMVVAAVIGRAAKAWPPKLPSKWPRP